MGLRVTLHGIDGASTSALPLPASSNFASSAFADTAPLAAEPSSAAGAASSGLAWGSSLAFWAGRLPLFSFPFLRTSFRSRRRALTSSSPPCDRVSDSFVAVRPKCPFSSSSPSAPQRGPQSPCSRKAPAEAARRLAPLSQSSAFCRLRARSARSSPEVCRSSAPVAISAWRNLRTSSSRSLARGSWPPRICLADWSLMYCSSCRMRSSAAVHLRCTC
mmetsp:Transcript_11815/g.31409  ORF Transcript_11815/g.31409 Transcript_11815/m.31409 type:complete len:218 (+) Transcript_11815:1295-1948(+)